MFYFACQIIFKLLLPVILPRMPPRKPEAEVPRRCEGTVVGRESELCGGLPLTIVRTVTWREPFNDIGEEVKGKRRMSIEVQTLS